MKIISIKFLNLNSLKGEHEIRFDRPPFNESGIFAITGPTGAGKTTLLDAVTVALYGKVHRHSKDVFEIMTRHTAESFAEVEFEVGATCYRAKWSIRRSRGKADGQLQTQKMELAEVATGKILIEHPLQEVKDEIVQCCGLDYNQFLRSVILSQGDFTRFLKADENERSELLEKITDTGIYSQISVAAFDKAREERNLLEQLRNRLENVVLLSAEERGIYHAELAALGEKETTLKTVEAEQRKAISWLSTVEKLEARKEELSAQLSAAELFQAGHEPRFVRLQQHLRALVHRPALAELSAIENQQQRIGLDLEQAKQQYPGLQQAAQVSRTALETAKATAATQEQALKALEPVLERVTKQDILIAQATTGLARSQSHAESGRLALSVVEERRILLGQQLQVTQDRIDLLQQWLQAHAGDEELNKAVIVFQQLLQQLQQLEEKAETASIAEEGQRQQKEQAAAMAAAAAQRIAETQKNRTAADTAAQLMSSSLLTLLAGKSTEDLEMELRELPVLINTSAQQLKVATAYHKQAEEEKELSATLARDRQREAEVWKATAQLQQDSNTAQSLLQDLQQIYELEVKVGNYDAARKLLKAEEPCPLCGALHHPFVEGQYQARISESAARRNQQEAVLQQLKAELDRHLLQTNTLQHQLETGGRNLTLLRETQQDLLAEFTANNDSLPKPLDIHRTDIITAVIHKKTQQQKALQQQLQAAKTLSQQLLEGEALARQQRERLAAEQNKAEQAALTITFADQQLEAIRKERAAVAAESESLRQKAAQLLLPFGLEFDLRQGDNHSGELNSRYQQYQRNVLELQQLLPDLRQRETELKSTAVSLAEKQEILTQLLSQLQAEEHTLQQLVLERKALFGDKDPAAERLGLTTAQEQHQLDVQRQQILVQEQQEQVRVVEDRQLQLNSSFLQTKALFEQHLEQLTARITTDGFGSVAALRLLFLPDDEAAAAEQLQQQAVQQITAARSLLSATAADLAAEKALALTSAPMAALMLELNESTEARSALQQQLFNLSKVLADDDQLTQKHAEVAAQVAQQQLEFDRFQQLSALIGSADGKKFSRFAQGLTLARLTELANRHLLRLSDRYLILKSPEKDLDLQIIDGYQADVVRPMSTLSGGESFLVSLALALGLSDLASRKVQINSLFIDEGFGTLDAETLDVAITALENLQASGKNIGIISHVEALKERIGTQIQLNRLPGGSSMITLSSYGQKINN